MHSYHHNIKTFNSATRHLTRVERSLYRDLIELYYDTEQPLPANDFQRLCRLVIAQTEDEIDALRYVLSEFFVLTGDVYSHDYCDDQIEKYKQVHTSKALAGKASAAAKAAKSEARKRARSTKSEQKATCVEHALNTGAAPVTNHEPRTMNQEPETIVKDLRQASGSTADDGQDERRAIWGEYSEAYFERYSTMPVRNAKVNGQIRTLHQRLGNEAKHVARFFVGIHDQYLIKRFHEFGLLVAQAESYRTQWATGVTMTATRARQLDQTAANASAVDESIAILRAMNAAKRGAQQ